MYSSGFFFFFFLGDWALPEKEKNLLDCSILAADLPQCHPVVYWQADLKKKTTERRV